MKYIFFGLPTYMSDRILNIFGSLSNVASSTNIIGTPAESLDVGTVINIKERIKASPHTAVYLPAYPLNMLPVFSKLPPGDFRYTLIYLKYSIYDYILYKTIESMQSASLSLQDINRFILTNDSHVRSWKSQFEQASRTGVFDLSFALQFDVARYVKDPSKYIKEFTDVSESVISGSVANNKIDNPLYLNRYNVPEHYYNSTKDIMLGDNTLQHILEL